MTGPTLTNGGIILLGLAVVAAIFVWRYFRNSDDIAGRRCWRCGEQLHPRTPSLVRWCSEYCQQRWYDDQLDRHRR